MRRSFESVLYDWLGQEWCGTTGPPANHLTLYVEDPHLRDRKYVFSTLNDGFELGIGYPHSWLCIIRKEVALKAAWFIIWRWWIRGTWCGLRTAIWYWLLNRRVNRYKAVNP
mgnify:CR=1 FL=1